MGDSPMDRFARWVEQTRGVLLPDYAALHMWSVEHLEDFWGAVWSYFGVVASVAPERVLASNQMPGARWFRGRG
ncbi:acetyl-coenzyme A synthetase N-terminal domain-containing protein [Kocuria varians]|nr:acetyl-coenzyme A synthetase N-terminal domain-containing protein [Kocuria varians]